MERSDAFTTGMPAGSHRSAAFSEGSGSTISAPSSSAMSSREVPPCRRTTSCPGTRSAKSLSEEGMAGRRSSPRVTLEWRWAPDPNKEHLARKKVRRRSVTARTVERIVVVIVAGSLLLERLKRVIPRCRG